MKTLAVFISIVILSMSGGYAPDFGSNICQAEIPMDYEMQCYVNNIARYYDVSPGLIYAIIESESGFDPDARNGSCVGLMQVNENIHQERAENLGVSISEPRGNIAVGVSILAEKIEGYGNIEYALCAYNGGDQYAWRKIEEGATHTPYVDKILRRAIDFEY